MYRLVLGPPPAPEPPESKGWLGDLFRIGARLLHLEPEPAPAADMALIDTAIAEARSVIIVYGGGSHPGAARRVWPRAIDGADLLAVDADAVEPRRYHLSLITDVYASGP